MTPHEIARRRLRNQRLCGRPVAALEAAVGWFGAMQAQELGVAKWSIGQRTRDLTEAMVDRALADGRILRTHVLRPTWHFILPADIRWIIELTAPRVRTMMSYYDRRLELDDAVFAKSHRVIAKALAGGRHGTRQELQVVLQKAGIAARGQRLGHLVMRAELDLVICSGAPKGKQQTYARFDERASPARSFSREEALAELTRRYFTAHGPATLKDYCWWSSLTAAEARRGLEMLAGELEREVVGDRTYWSAGSPSPAQGKSPAAHLLQGYDEYIVAYTESKDVLRGPAKAGRPPAPVVPFTHAVVLDGHVVGHWRRVPGKATTSVEVFLAMRLDTAERRAFEAAVERYAGFTGLPASVYESGPGGLSRGRRERG